MYISTQTVEMFKSAEELVNKLPEVIRKQIEVVTHNDLTTKIELKKLYGINETIYLPNNVQRIEYKGIVL